MRQLIFILLAIIGVSQAQTIQYIGAPTTTVISRGNFRTDSIFYLPKRSKAPTDTAALRYQISDSSLYAWTGSQWRKVGADADTLVYSTRAWRQKGDDSLAARINLKVNISDTASMLAPYLRKADTTAMLSPYYRSATASAALALKLNISDTSSMLGNYVRHAGYGLTKSGQSLLVDTLNIATRAWRQKGLDSLAALEVSGSGTTNYVAKFTAGSTIGNSQIFDNGTNVGINTTTPTDYLSFGRALEINSSSFGAALYLKSTASTTYGYLGYDRSALQTILGAVGTSTGIRFDANGSTRMTLTSGGDFGIGTVSPSGRLHLSSTNAQQIFRTDESTSNYSYTQGVDDVGIYYSNNSASRGYRWINGGTERLRIFANGRVFIGASPTDAGYQLDVNGTLRSVNGANFATTSGQVGIGKTSPSAKSKLDVEGNIDIADGSFYYLRNAVANTGTYGMYYSNSAPKYPIRLAVNADPTNNRFFEIGWHKNDNKDSTWNPTFSVNSYNAETFINTTSDAGDYKLQVSGNIYNTGSAVLAATSGNVGIGTASPSAKLTVVGAGAQTILNSGSAADARMEFHYNSAREGFISWDTDNIRLQADAGNYLTFFTNATERGRINSAGEWIIDASGTDAGDYKLQVVGNARIGTGKLDIASNTTFGIGVARSGTSEVAGQIYNSNGILYLGAESSAGGQIFSGSSAYAAVIGSGANYPLQFAANNITRATMTTNGNFMIGFPTDTYFYRLQVNGSIFSNNQIIAQNAAAQLNIDSSTNISPLYISNQSLTGSSAQGLFYGSTTWNTTGNPSLIDLAITNTASGSDANYIKISDGSNIFKVTKAAEVVTAAPTGGSIRKWKLGEAATVSPTSPNRTIRVEIDGVVYYLHAKTTND